MIFGYRVVKFNNTDGSELHLNAAQCNTDLVSESLPLRPGSWLFCARSSGYITFDRNLYSSLVRDTYIQVELSHKSGSAESPID